MAPTASDNHPSMPSMATGGGTALDAEVARFAGLAGDWWDPEGPMAPLHRLNPARVRFIRDHLARYLGRRPEEDAPLAGLDILDIGCGGGILCEPMARLGATVTGIDAAGENIAAARRHAADMGLSIAYREILPEDLAARGVAFDVVLNMEVVEHVADLGAFLGASTALMRPGGATVVATLNRTMKSLALAKLGAEYILRWLPPGTHDWRRFVKPSELARHLAAGGVEIRDLQGVGYRPWTGEWSLTQDLAVNYLAFGVKTG